MTLSKKPLENAVGKGDIDGNWHFLLFRLCSLFYQGQIQLFEPTLICHLQLLSIKTSPKFCLMVLRQKYFMSVINCNVSMKYGLYDNASKTQNTTSKDRSLPVLVCTGS